MRLSLQLLLLLLLLLRPCLRPLLWLRGPPTMLLRLPTVHLLRSHRVVVVVLPLLVRILVPCSTNVPVAGVALPLLV